MKSFDPAFPALPETFGVNRPREGCDASLFDLKLRVLAGNGILWGENAEDNSRKFSPAPLYGSACLMLERLFAGGKLKKEEWLWRAGVSECEKAPRLLCTKLNIDFAV